MSRQAAPIIYNALTLLFVGLTLAVGAATLAIAGEWMEPPLFKPGQDVPPTLAALASPTATLPAAPVAQAVAAAASATSAETSRLPETPTPSPALVLTLPPTIVPSPTRTPLPTRGATGPTFTPTATLTWTPAPSASPAPLGPSPTPTPVMPFMIQPGTPMLRSNFANTEGCNWQGVAGLVVDSLGDPVIGLRVVVSSESIAEQSVLSGASKFYGPSGWEVKLGTVPDNGRYQVWLAAEDGTPLSFPAEIVFPAACEQNLALVNFVQIRLF